MGARINADAASHYMLRYITSREKIGLRKPLLPSNENADTSLLTSRADIVLIRSSDSSLKYWIKYSSAVVLSGVLKNSKILS